MMLDIVKVSLPLTVAFALGIALTPLLTHYLYKYRAWKKKAGKQAGMAGGGTPIFNELHKSKEVGTPRMGGIVVWGSATVTIVLIWLYAQISGSPTAEKLDFLSRNQTWIPLFTLLIGSLVGLIDDVLEVRGGGGYAAGGFSLRKRLLIVSLLSLFVGWWLYDKLDVAIVSLPLFGHVYLGWGVIPAFLFVALALYASGVIDGIDGLAGGVFAAIFTAYAGIAFFQNQIDLAAFCATLVGAILAFLWFNIPPARFYLSETGTMGLTLALAVVAFMTDSLAGGYGVSVLPVIAFPLVVTVCSNIIQICSKRFRGKKVFLVAPLHHHFEALGWPGHKVTMRYWVLAAMFAIIGMIAALIA